MADLMTSNIEFSCRPESADHASVQRTAFFPTGCTQADNCNDLLSGALTSFSCSLDRISYRFTHPVEATYQEQKTDEGS